MSLVSFLQLPSTTIILLAFTSLLFFSHFSMALRSLLSSSSSIPLVSSALSPLLNGHTVDAQCNTCGGKQKEQSYQELSLNACACLLIEKKPKWGQLPHKVSNYLINLSPVGLLLNRVLRQQHEWHWLTAERGGTSRSSLLPSTWYRFLYSLSTHTIHSQRIEVIEIDSHQTLD